MGALVKLGGWIFMLFLSNSLQDELSRATSLRQEVKGGFPAECGQSQRGHWASTGTDAFDVQTR